MASAAPRQLGKVDNIDLIATTIQNKLGQLGRLDFRHLAGVTWKALQSNLDAAAQVGNSPDILHFIGHGDLNNGRSVIALMRDPDDTSRLPRELRDQDAAPDSVDWCDVGELARQLRLAPPWLLFLQTCKGASTATQVEGARSAAQQLADVKVSFVVAMQYEIENNDAAIFAETFYACVGAGGRSTTRSASGGPSSATSARPGSIGALRRRWSTYAATTRCCASPNRRPRPGPAAARSSAPIASATR